MKIIIYTEQLVYIYLPIKAHFKANCLWKLQAISKMRKTIQKSHQLLRNKLLSMLYMYEYMLLPYMKMQTQLYLWLQSVKTMRTKQRGNKDSHRSKKQKDDLGILNNHIPVTGIAGFNTSVMSDKLCRCNDERSYTSYTWMCCVPTNEDASLPALVLNHKMLIAVKREDAERLCVRARWRLVEGSWGHEKNATTRWTR